MKIQLKILIFFIIFHNFYFVFSIKANESKADTIQINKLIDLYNSKKYFGFKTKSPILDSITNLSKASKNKRFIALAYQLNGKLFMDNGDLSNAFLYFNDALKIYEEIGDSINFAYINLNLVDLYFLRGLDFFDDAYKHDINALEIFKIKKDTLGIAMSYRFLGQLISDSLITWDRKDKLNLKESEFLLNKSLDLLQKINNHDEIAFVYMSLAKLYSQQLKHQQAVYYSNKALECFDKSRNLTGLATVYKNLGRDNMIYKDYNQAIINLGKSKIIADSIDNPDLMNNIYENLSDAYYELKDYKKSLDFFKLSVAKKFQIYSKDRMVSLASYEKKLEVTKKDREIELLQKTNQIKDLELNRKNTYITASILVALFIVILIFVFYRIREIRKNEHFQNNLLASKLQALELQMNPHFIFNTMNSIKYLIDKDDNETASLYLLKLSKLMRSILEHTQKHLLTLAEEIDILKLYIELELLRFDNKFEFEFILDKNIELSEVQIPPMLIQPFVENSIYHGLIKKDGKGKLEISFQYENNFLKCTILDNGIGRSKAEELKINKSNHKSMGITTSKQRLDLLNTFYKKSINQVITDLYDDNKNPLGTKVELFIPLESI